MSDTPCFYHPVRSSSSIRVRLSNGEWSVTRGFDQRKFESVIRTHPYGGVPDAAVQAPWDISPGTFGNVPFSPGEHSGASAKTSRKMSGSDGERAGSGMISDMAQCTSQPATLKRERSPSRDDAELEPSPKKPTTILEHTDSDVLAEGIAFGDAAWCPIQFPSLEHNVEDDDIWNGDMPNIPGLV